MGTRIIAGVAGAVILLGALLWNGWSWSIFIALLAMAGIKELFQMCGMKAWSSFSVLGYMAVFGIIIGKVDIYLVFLVVFLAAVLLSLRNQKELNVTHVALFVLGLYYIIVGFYNSVIWYESYGKMFVLFIIILIWASDSFAYFAGYFFGRHKMAPVLSPKKTYEGLLGGMIGTVVLATFLNKWFHLDLTLLHAVVVGLFVAIIAPIGDLFESSIKRHYGMKDSGNLLPGHGGVLDRFDSFLFVMLFYPFIQMLSL